MRLSPQLAGIRTAVPLALALVVQFTTAARAIADDEPSPTNAKKEKDRYAVTVQTLLPNGRPAPRSYLTLWRALAPGDKDPVNTVNGPRGFGYYNPVIWDDKPSGARWVRAGSAYPNDGRHGWEEAAFRFTDLPPGRYRFTAVSYRRSEERYDPTPYGVSAPFTLGPSDRTPRSIDVHLGGTAPLLLRFLDAESREPIARLAVRLRNADGMPIVHGHGTGNFFERTGDNGEVAFDHLHPGDYTVQVLGKQARVNDFVQYEPIAQWAAVQVDAAGPSDVEILVPPRTLDAEEIEKRFPFYVYGRVTDEEGNPLADVQVRAATGMGTLFGGGRTRTDAQGRYRLYFGPGMRTRVNKEFAPRGVGVQAALISASAEGRHETSFNRQGDLRMSDRSPESLEQEIKTDSEIWGKTSLDRFVLPGHPREINFTLAPAAVLSGTLAWGTREMKDQRLYLTGDDLPPGSSVLRSLTTDRDGHFELDGIPVGKPWRFGMRVQGTFHEIETQPFTLDTQGPHKCEVLLDVKPTEDGGVTLRLRYREVEE